MNDPRDFRAIERKLCAFRNMQLVLGHAISLLHDAKGFAAQVKADGWYATHIGEHEEALKTDILPEVDAAIEGLEEELRP